MSTTSKTLIILQFFCLGYLLFSFSTPVIGFILLFQILGFSLALWSVFIMKIGNFNIQPEVKTAATLTIKGPYKLIRNPMYTGLLLFFGAGLFSNFHWIDLLVYILLVIVLLLKIKQEEHYLLKHFGESYLSYKNGTKKILPYIF